MIPSLAPEQQKLTFCVRHGCILAQEDVFSGASAEFLSVNCSEVKANSLAYWTQGFECLHCLSNGTGPQPTDFVLMHSVTCISWTAQLPFCLQLLSDNFDFLGHVEEAHSILYLFKVCRIRSACVMANQLQGGRELLKHVANWLCMHDLDQHGYAKGNSFAAVTSSSDGVISSSLIASC